MGDELEALPIDPDAPPVSTVEYRDTGVLLNVKPRVNAGGLVLNANRNVTVGGDAQGEAVVSVEHDGRTYHGKGFDTDIVEASALAFLQAVNRICDLRRRQGDSPNRPSLAAAGPG